MQVEGRRAEAEKKGELKEVQGDDWSHDERREDHGGSEESSGELC